MILNLRLSTTFREVFVICRNQITAYLSLGLRDTVFPRMIQLVGIVKEPFVFIFGLLYRIRHREEQKTPLVLQLHTSTYEMILVPSRRAPCDIMIYEGGGTVEGDRIIFGLGHRATDDPNQRNAFDLSELEWSEPLPGTY